MNVDPPSDDESLDWNVGVIDGIRPPPNKADIVAELTRAQSTVSNLPPVLDEPDESPSPGKTGMNAPANQTMTDKMSWRALASNQIEVSKYSQNFNDDAMMDIIDDTSQATSHALRKNRVEVAKRSQTSKDDVMMDNADDTSQDTDQWELNVSRLVGLTNDGVPPSFLNSEYSFVINKGSKLKVRYSPAPCASRKAYQQKRCGQWRVQQKHKQFKKSICPPSWRSLNTPSDSLNHMQEYKSI